MIRFISIVGLAIILTSTASYGRGGGGGMHHSSLGGGGAFGTPVNAPGTNSLGTALSSSGVGSPTKGAELGTNPAIDREEAAVDRMVKGSICQGC